MSSPDWVSFEGTDYQCRPPRKGHLVAFYLNEDSLEDWFPALITKVNTPTRVHLSVFEPNGHTIRKSVDRATDDRIKYRWLPLDVAHQIEEDS